MEDVKKVRKVARQVKVLLEIDGLKATSKQIVEIIKEEDLGDLTNLKEKVKVNMADVEKKSTRRDSLKVFIISNWKDIKDNSEVKEALFNAYCMGRYDKNKRAEMVSQLVNACETPETVVVPVEVTATTDVKDVNPKNYEF